MVPRTQKERSPPITPPGNNRLLGLFLEDDLAALRPHLKTVVLNAGDTLLPAGEPVEQVYFVSDGLVSLVQLMPSGKYSETGLVGREGIVGVLVPLGSSATSHEAVVQIAGTAFRMRADALRRETSQRSAMTDILLRYVQAQFAQIAQSAACNNLHPVGLRLARWLLMASDSAETDNLALTHQLLCMMLGVRRSTVTTELAALKTKGLIATRMGGVTITNRPGLEAASCECYRTVCTEFRRLLGPPIFQDTVD